MSNRPPRRGLWSPPRRPSERSVTSPIAAATDPRDNTALEALLRQTRQASVPSIATERLLQSDSEDVPPTAATDESMPAFPTSPLNHLPTTSLTSPTFATPSAPLQTAPPTASGPEELTHSPRVTPAPNDGFFAPQAYRSSPSSTAVAALRHWATSAEQRPTASFAGSRTTTVHAAPSRSAAGKTPTTTAKATAWPPYLRNPVRQGTRYPFLHIPTQWSMKDRSSGIDLTSSSVPHLRAYYTGPGEGDKDAAAVRADAPVYAPGGIYYFEVTILSKGKEGYISVGLSGPKVALNRLPGWEQQSWGYHGDDGNQFSCSGNGIPYGPKYTTGDVIGCCINYYAREIFYTKNGHRLGPAHLAMHWDKMPYLYPTIGLRTRGEGVEANFGFSPFQYNIGMYVREQQEKVLSVVHAQPLPLLPYQQPVTQKSALLATPTTMMTGKHKKKKKFDHQWSDQPEPPQDEHSIIVPHVDSVMQEDTVGAAPAAIDESITSEEQLLDSIVCRYLMQSGYLETARTLKQSASIVQQRDLIDTEENYHRRDVIDALSKYDSRRAVALVHQHYKDLPTHNLDAWLDLRCAEFLDRVMACNAAEQTHPSAEGWDDVIQAGQALWDEFGVEQLKGAREQRLQEIFSIVAYVHIESSPVAYLLSPSHREDICSRVNRALLAYHGQPPLTNLEAITKTAMVALEEAACVGQAACSLLNLDEFLSSS